MVNTLCTKCEFGVVRLESSTAHFQSPIAFCMLIDKVVGEVAKCTGFQRYESDVEDDE
jgi:hypothetical protein